MTRRSKRLPALTDMRPGALFLNTSGYAKLRNADPQTQWQWIAIVRLRTPNTERSLGGEYSDGSGQRRFDLRSIVGHALIWGAAPVGWAIGQFGGTTDSGVLVGALMFFFGFGVGIREGGLVGTHGTLLALLFLFIGLPIIGAFGAAWVIAAVVIVGAISLAIFGGYASYDP